MYRLNSDMIGVVRNAHTHQNEAQKSSGVCLSNTTMTIPLAHPCDSTQSFNNMILSFFVYCLFSCGYYRHTYK